MHAIILLLAAVATLAAGLTVDNFSAAGPTNNLGFPRSGSGILSIGGVALPPNSEWTEVLSPPDSCAAPIKSITFEFTAMITTQVSVGFQIRAPGCTGGSVVTVTAPVNTGSGTNKVTVQVSKFVGADPARAHAIVLSDNRLGINLSLVEVELASSSPPASTTTSTTTATSTASSPAIATSISSATATATSAAPTTSTTSSSTVVPTTARSSTTTITSTVRSSPTNSPIDRCKRPGSY
ncbi:hypothetical protein H9P43_002201 [Blastocladiella emersonii ATCC 22665]|nr:hypothetical protein H9P43_002201 [Blastocladiella emersonii ATCC 22665]